MSGKELEDPKAAKERAKAEKKLAKARVKAEKKLGAGAPTGGPATPEAPAPAIPSAPGAPDGLTPAERSARAAERQVSLQRWRILFALLGFVVALATLLWMIFFR
jgi:hypothetical protein